MHLLELGPILHLDPSPKLKALLCLVACWCLTRVLRGSRVAGGEAVIEPFYGWEAETWRPPCLLKSRRICTSRNRLWFLVMQEAVGGVGI